MIPVALKRTLVLLVLAALALPVAAQTPPATSEQRAAGDRVASVEFSVDELIVEREATTSLEVRLLDGDGNPVDEAVALLVARVSVSPQVVPLTGTVSAELTGGAPGEGELAVIVMRSEDSGGGAFRMRGAALVGTLPVRVLEWPAGSIEIDEPRYAAYVGTSLRLAGRVLTDRGTEHSTAGITWRSSDPSAALVTAGGVLIGLNPGRVTVTAHTENNVVAGLEVDVVTNPVTGLSLTPQMARARTGDVVEFEIMLADVQGRAVTDASVDLSVSGLDGTAGRLPGHRNRRRCLVGFSRRGLPT